jgi:hypothetical protein
MVFPNKNLYFFTPELRAGREFGPRVTKLDLIINKLKVLNVFELVN